MLILCGSGQAAHTGLGTKARVAQVLTKVVRCLLILGVSSNAPEAVLAADPIKPDQALETRIQGLIPDLERYITSGTKAFDVPGLAIGIVANDKLVYGKGFGVRAKDSGGRVDTRTVFQIGSTTKTFLAPTIAMIVDRGRFKWGERGVGLFPAFQFKEPRVKAEFRG